jgi:hypothetical protein
MVVGMGARVPAAEIGEEAEMGTSEHMEVTGSSNS